MIRLNMRFLAIIFFLILFTTVSFAKEKTFTKEAVEVVPASQSQDQVIAYLTQKLTREATEEAGTFITSELNIKNYEITKDEFSSFAGAISKVKVENKETFTKNNQQYVKVKLNVTVDTDNVKTYLEKIMQDNEYKKEAEELRQKNLELEKQLKTATKEQYEKELSTQVKQQVELQKKQELEIEKLTLKAKQEYAKAKEEQDKKTAEREKEILELKNKIAQEQNNIKKAELENQARIKELENKAKNELKNYNAKTNSMTVQKAIEETKNLRKKISEIITNFETLIKTNRDNLIKSYDEQIKLAVNDSSKGMWETQQQYNERIKNGKTLKQNLEEEKADNIFEYNINFVYINMPNNIKTLDSMFVTLEPFQKRLKELQKGKYFDKSRKTFGVESLGYANADEKYFPINVKYKGEEYSLRYDFADIGIEKAQLLYKTQKQFVMEPMFSVNNNMKSEFVGFYGKHLGTNAERTWDLRKSKYRNVQLEELAEIKEIEKYKELDEILKTLKHMSELDKVRREINSYGVKFDNAYWNSELDKNKNFMSPILTELKNGDILDKQNYINKVKPYIKRIVAIAAGYDALALKADGTVSSTNYNSKIYVFKDLVAISEGYGTVLGIRKDKTVIAEGDNKYGKCNVENWTNIVAVAAGESHTVGLKSDGTVVAIGSNEEGQCNVKNWKDIVAISAGYSSTIGIKKDGTFVTAGIGDYYLKELTEPEDTKKLDVQDPDYLKKWNKIKYSHGWKKVVAVKHGYSYLAGLTKETQVSLAEPSLLSDFTEEDKDKIYLAYGVIKIEGSGSHILCLKDNGTVISAGKNDKGQCNTKDWKDIVDIACGYECSFGLKKDGTVVVVGNKNLDTVRHVGFLMKNFDEKGNII